MLQVMSANRLRDGAVVFLGPQGVWVESLDEALVCVDEQALESSLAQAKADERANLVLDLAAFEIVQSSKGIRAAHLRDAIRAAGPTVHRDHGKQALRP
jgi:sulfite reductase (NADPH) hemoprotein beta-component